MLHDKNASSFAALLLVTALVAALLTSCDTIRTAVDSAATAAICNNPDTAELCWPLSIRLTGGAAGSCSCYDKNDAKISAAADMGIDVPISGKPGEANVLICPASAVAARCTDHFARIKSAADAECDGGGYKRRPGVVITDASAVAVGIECTIVRSDFYPGP